MSIYKGVKKRFEAVLRRGIDTTTSTPLGDSLPLGAYTYDSPSRTLTLDKDRRQLTEREAELLELLYCHRNRTLDRSRALLDLWGDDSYHNGRSMDVFISRLRKYLSADDTVEIRTVHGQGFRLVVRD